MGEKGIITVQFDEQDELISVDLGAGELKKPTHSLFDQQPSGVLKGFTNMGKTARWHEKSMRSSTLYAFLIVKMERVGCPFGKMDLAVIRLRTG